MYAPKFKQKIPECFRFYITLHCIALLDCTQYTKQNILSMIFSKHEHFFPYGLMFFDSNNIWYFFRFFFASRLLYIILKWEYYSNQCVQLFAFNAKSSPLSQFMICSIKEKVVKSVMCLLCVNFSFDLGSFIQRFLFSDFTPHFSTKKKKQNKNE